MWLTPHARWRRRYTGLRPALRKLEYVDQLMHELRRPSPAPVRSRRIVDPLHGIRKTLREHYREKRSRYGVENPREYDAALRLVFSTRQAQLRQPSGGGFLRGARSSSALSWPR